MTESNWTIDIIGQAKKAHKTLSGSAASAYGFLLIELEALGHIVAIGRTIPK
jgi:hypothetical protein